MKLNRRFDKAISVFVAITLILGVASFLKLNSTGVFAEGDGTTAFSTAGAKYVTFYDAGEKLIVKTEAATVKEALERAGISIQSGDIVDPGIDTAIDADNFFINIYRARPVVVRDGAVEKYLMTASYDAKTVMKEAGITVYDGDEVKLVNNDGFLENGVANVYEITRNGGRTLTEEEEIEFPTETVKDYNLAPGTSEVRQLGEVGVKRIYYNVQFVDNVEVSREYVSEEIVKEPVKRIVAEGASAIEQNPLTPGKGTNIYTANANGGTVLRKETYYDLPMGQVARNCGNGGVYTVREDGAKVDAAGYVLVAANLSRYARCSVVETSLGPGKVYDTGGFAAYNPEQFDLATDWSDRNGI